MNKWIYGVCAVIAGGSLAQARTSGEDWSTLDEEIDRLVSSQPAQSGGPALGVLLRPIYITFDGVKDDEGTPTPDIGGFALAEADAWVEGSIGSTAWRLSSDFKDGAASLEDAYALMCLTNEAGLTFGQYRNPTLHASRIDPENQILLERPWLAQGFTSFDQGAMVDFSSGQFGGFFSIQNGETGLEAIHSYMARIEMLLNDGSTVNRNWAKRTSGHLGENTTLIGVFHYEDDVRSDAQVNGVDVAANFSNWRVEAEAIDIDKDVPPGFIGTPDTTPWDVAGQLAVNPNFNVAVRYQDSDDSADTTGITLGVDYIPGDPSVYWSAEIDLIDSDDKARDTEILRIGLTVGASRTR